MLLIHNYSNSLAEALFSHNFDNGVVVHEDLDSIDLNTEHESIHIAVWVCIT